MSSTINLNEKQKLVISGMFALLFFILNHPLVYKLVNGIVSLITGPGVISNFSGCPTTLGVTVHSIVFLMLCRAVLQVPLKDLTTDSSFQELSEQSKWKISGMAALSFIIIGMPWTFSAVNRVLNGFSPSEKTIIATPVSKGSCPTILGLIVHTIVFFGLTRGLLEI